MTDPSLLWLDGDPTDARRARLAEPPPPVAEPVPVPAAPRRTGLLRAALAGGLVSAVLVGGGAVALGAGDKPVATPAAVSAKQTGDVTAIYAAARDSVVSVKTAE